MIRIIKAALVACIGLHALFYAIQNIANLEQAHGALLYVMSLTGHEVYPNTAFFALGNPALAWVALGAVLIGEFAIVFFGIKVGWDLLCARHADASEFEAAKKAGIVAAGLALLVWFGLFMTFGAAFFQMWQTEVGTGSMNGAIMYGIASAIVMLFVCLTADD